jgi:hypothetical protein
MRTRTDLRQSVSAVAAVALAALLSKLIGGTVPLSNAATDPYASYRGRASVSLGVTDRTFTSTSNPDFAGTAATAGAGRYEKIAADTLAADGKPVFNSTGYLVSTDWKNSAGQPIIAPRSYINSAAGDTSGAMSATAGGAVTSATSFNQWFRTTSGVNTASASSMAMIWNGSSYVFDGSLDTFNNKNNFDYTAEVDTTFIQDSTRNYYINVATGAEAFVYIDGKLVIDGGGGMPSTAADPGLPGGHFDVDVYNQVSNKQTYHKHQYDDSYNTAHIDIAQDTQLLFHSIVGANTHLLRVQVYNTDNGGWGTYSFAAGSQVAENWISAGLDRTFLAADLTQLRFDFRTLALMAHTDPGSSHADTVHRAGGLDIRITDTVTGKVIYELATYHHGTAPTDYATLRAEYNAQQNNAIAGPMPGMTQRIDISRLAGLDDGTTHTIKVFFANRTGSPSNFHFETNIDTLDLVALPVVKDFD